MALSFNDVNRRNSYTWVKCNDDAQSDYFRNKFVQKYGGEFVKKGNEWEWNPSKSDFIVLDSGVSKEPKPVRSDPLKTWVFMDKDGNILKTKNVQDFCKTNNLTRSSLYEVISGKRKSHKGFSFVEIITD